MTIKKRQGQARQLVTPHGATDTEKANSLFLEQAQRMPGVLRVEPYGGKTIGEQSFRVFVRKEDIETEYRIYDLQGELYERYPGVRLDVWVLEEQDAVAPDSASG